MRTYLSMPNFLRALVLGLIATVMSVPRLIQGGLPLGLYIPATLVGMMLVSGAATAWSDRGGMCGMVPAWRRMLVGVGVAVLVSAIATPVVHLWVDPSVRQALQATGNPHAMALRYPATVAGCLAVVLWSASFETLFFQAATVSFFARLTNRQSVAIVLAVALRLCVSLHQMTELGVVDAVPLMLVSTAVMATVACILFARTGLVAAMVLGAGLDLHLFLSRT